ncbi:MAG: GTP cyclohydrolase IIa [Desulfurococcaceae archaeon]
MVRVGLLRLVDYESWIASLGYDREHIVQASQHSMLGDVYRWVADIGSFPIPLTYDLIALILNSVGMDEYLAVAKRVASKSPVPVAALCGEGDTYTEALANAREQASWTGDGDELTAAVHVDLNGYYRILEEGGAHRAYELISALAEQLRGLASKLGGLAAYMGGDNVLAFIPVELVDKFTSEALSAADVKIGVGLASKPRDAVALSTKALTAIRRAGSKRRSFKLKEGE